MLSTAIEANIIARGTVGFSGADLENLVNQAALKAAVDGKDMVTLKELEFAKDKILMGEQRHNFSFRNTIYFFPCPCYNMLNLYINPYSTSVISFTTLIELRIWR